jgi:hypothetical protein
MDGRNSKDNSLGLNNKRTGSIYMISQTSYLCIQIQLKCLYRKKFEMIYKSYNLQTSSIQVANILYGINSS